MTYTGFDLVTRYWYSGLMPGKVKKRLKIVSVEETEEVVDSSTSKDSALVTDKAVVASTFWQEKKSTVPKVEPKTGIDNKEYTDQNSVPNKKMADTLNLPQQSDKSGGMKYVWIAIIVLLIGALVGGGFYFFQRSQSETEEPTDETIVDIPTPQNTPTPTVGEVDIEGYTIRVLNGSGKTGEAGKVRTTLETEGFEISSTGNADKSTYEETVIQARKDVPAAVLKKLRDVLSKSYVLASNITLNGDDEDDIVIIVGSETTTSSVQGSSTSVTPTPTKKPITTGTVTPTPTKTATSTPTPTP